MTPELARAAVRLAATLLHENAALNALDFATAGQVLVEKTGALQEFVSVQAVAGSAGPSSVEANDLARRLAALVQENQRLLERAILVQGRVLGTIARAAPRALRETPRCYGRTGAVAPGQPAVALSSQA